MPERVEQKSREKDPGPRPWEKSGNPHPHLLTLAGATVFSGFSKSELYRRLAKGCFTAVKSGTRTLIVTESLRAHLDSLPIASFGAPKAAA